VNEAEIIKEARDIVAGGAWTKGHMRRANADGGSSYCALGALHEASMLSIELRSKCIHMTERFAPDVECAGLFNSDGFLLETLRPLSRFNDHPDTRLEDIVNIFDKALAELGAL
jgi:hypothetical protein